MVNVTFTDVGRGKASWSATCEEVTFDWLYDQVKSKAMVLSTELNFSEEGTIFAGFHPIGKFQVDYPFR